VDLDALRAMEDGSRRYPPAAPQSEIELNMPQGLDGDRALLGAFLPNGSWGFTMSLADTETVPTYEYNRRVAQVADEHGLDFVFPIARWKGTGGPSDHWGVCLENFTLAAAVSQVTERVNILSTVHSSLMHPVAVAKLGATVDQISNGRWGLNIVAGWHLDENDMFDVPRYDHEARYSLATEWIQIIKELWANGEIEHAGEYFTIKGGASWPRPKQSPRPPIVNAGSSPRGRDYAVSECDINFIVAGDRDSVVEQVADTKKRAAEIGKTCRVCLVVYGLIDPDPKKVKAMEDDIVENADWTSISNIVQGFSGSEASLIDVVKGKSELENYYKQMVLGTGGYPIVGSAESFAEELIWLIREGGVDGVIFSFFNWVSMLEYFCKEGLPLLVEAGVWSPAEGAKV
jgi:FMNH2-dependent dimethyl sulfone monooxygenase